MSCRFGKILVGDRCHLAVEAQVRRARGGRAHRSREPRRAEPSKERGVARVLREKAVRPAIGVGKDRLTAPSRACLVHPLRYRGQRGVPRDPGERALSLRSLSNGGVKQTVGAVEPLAEPPHLRADEPARHGVGVRAVDVGDAALLHGDVEAARVGAIERADGRDGVFGRKDRCGFHARGSV